MTTTRPSPLRTLARELSLPLGGRVALFLGADLALLGGALQTALLGGGEPPTMYLLLVLLPILTLGVLAMGDVVALERRAGCLDLVLALPESWLYFERRLAIVAGTVVAQSWLVVLLLWMVASFSFPILPALLHPVAVAAFLGAASFFWALRLESPGAVCGATLGSASLAGRWIGANPVPSREEAGNLLVGSADLFLSSTANCLLLLALAAFLVAFARRRLAHSESMLQ